jgi:sarcosine oxidase subunit beta
VVVVGGGLVGSSIAYHLAVAGLRTLLIERGDLASGASGANFGLVQVQDAEFGLSLDLTLQGYHLFSTLEAELDYDVGYGQSGYLLLVENDRQWAAMKERAAHLRECGVDLTLLNQDEACRLEPNLAPESVVGALYHPNEGQLDPFKLVHAYVLRGRQRGLCVWTHTEVKGIKTQNGRATGVDTGNGDISAQWVVLAAGAWTRHLGQTAGLDLPVRWVHGEALITETRSPIARNAMSTASFFGETEGAEDQVVAFCLNQRTHGNVMIGEAARVTGRLSRRVTSQALPAIANAAGRHFPVLCDAAILRAWAIPTAFTVDNRPLLGPVDELDGLLVATALKSTIILTPLVGKLVSAMITNTALDSRLHEFSPSRAITENENT